MAISEVYAGSDTFTTTEESIANATSATTAQSITDDGIYQVFLELNNLANADVFLVQVKEKVQSSSTQRVVYAETLANAQTTAAVWASPTLILMHGWDVTLKKVSGTDRAIAWSIRKVA